MHQIAQSHSKLLHCILPLRSIPIRKLYMNKSNQCKPDYFKIKSGQKRNRTWLDILDSLGYKKPNKKSSKWATMLLGLGLLGKEFIQNQNFLEHKEKYFTYGHKEQQINSDKLMELTNQVNEDLDSKIANFIKSDKSQTQLHFADNISKDIQHIGNLITQHDSYPKCGLPYYALLDDVDQVDLSKIKHIPNYNPLFLYISNPVKIDLTDLQEMELSENDINELKETFVLSEEAKKFLIATQLIEFHSFGVTYLKSLKYLIFMYIYAILAKSFNKNMMVNKKGLYQHPFRIRLVLYCALAITVYSVYLSVTADGYAMVKETADKVACNLGIEYAKGMQYKIIINVCLCLQKLLLK